MSKEFSTKRFQLSLNTWAQEAASPNAGAGTPAAIGSFWQEAGTPPGVPTTLFLKSRADDKGWLRQNLTGLNVFNVKDPTYGAVGDGVTSDNAAIAAAVAAANAAGGGIVYFPPVNIAGGKFYRLTKVNGQNFSVEFNNVHNIIIMGDGRASMIAMSDDSLAQRWDGFLVNNGSTNLTFTNLQLAGQGISNQGANDARIFAIESQAGDPVGSSNISVIGISWGAMTVKAGNSCMEVTADKVVQNVTYRYNGGFGVVNRTFAAGYGSASQRLLDGCIVADSYFNNYAQDEGVALITSTDTVKYTTSRVLRNIMSADTTSAIRVSGGIIAHNIGLTRGIIKLGMNAAPALLVGPLVVRSNVVNSTSLGLDASLLAFANGDVDFDITGNVIQSSGQNATVLVTAAVGAVVNDVLIADNVIVNDGAGLQVGCNVLRVEDVAVVGNIAVTTAAGNTSSCFGTGSTAVFAQVGNLAINTSATIIRTGLKQTPGAVVAANSSVCDNLISRCSRGVEYDGATFTGWRACMRNNITGETSSTIVLPIVGNVGVTQEGPAGPGSQCVLDGATPIGNASAPVGSLCSNTAGGQATAIFRKEAGAGVSGGTADWYGIGGYDLTFGALLGSVNTANRFFAPGGLDLAVETTTEIQLALPRPGTVRNLRMRCVAGTGGGTNSYFVRKNGVDTTLTVAMANTATTGSDTTHSFTVAVADLLSLRVSKSSGAGTPQSLIVGTMELV